MKQYILSANEAGLKEWPPGQLRLEGIPTTTNAQEADLIVYPGPLHMLRPPDLDKLPYMATHEDRYVFFHNADHTDQYGKRCLFIRCNLRKWNYTSDACSIAWPWGVNPKGDLDECVEVPSGGFLWDVSFRGWNSGLVRKVSAVSCRDNPKIKADIAIYPDFYGYLEDLPEGRRRRADFIRSLKESRIILCPESIPSVLPYRFFEAMSAGRYPLLIGRDYTLPFSGEGQIPYGEFCSWIDIDQSDEAGDVVAEIRSRHTDEVFIEKGRLARQCWQKWLSGDRWPIMMAYAVQAKLFQLGLTKEAPVFPELVGVS